MSTSGNPAHETKVFVLRKSDDEWQGVVSCTCGWKDGSTSRRTSDGAGAVAQALGRDHVAKEGPPSVGRRVGDGLLSGAGLLLIALVVITPVLLVIGVVNLVTGGDDDPEPDAPSGQLGPGSGIDCEKSVEYLMTKEYGGGWGSGRWPDGEYDSRVDQCEGR